MDETTSKFVEVYNEIDAWLRKMLDASDDPGFVQLVKTASASHPGVRRHAPFLKKVAHLRNFVIHHYRHQKPLALATPHVLSRITRIRNELVSPPSLLSLGKQSVVMCGPNDPIGKAAKLMHDGSFSQLPVYEGKRFHGLLTAETVARWLASNLADGQELVEEKPVAEVMTYQEHAEIFAFIGQNSTAIEALTLFDQFLHDGKRLEAILITQNGIQTEPAIGIFTVHDIPKIQRALSE